MDLVKIADEKMYQDKKYKKQKQYMNITKREEKSIGDEQGLLASRLRQKIFTILTNCSKKRRYAFVMTDVNKFHLLMITGGMKQEQKCLILCFRK